ncbi:ion channel protein [Agromyces sp. ZXT2-3]|uniref:ion channel protein n=1 Tax=Agromyces sp. ZXT2-3 TaxID=3461152 RepID=UPI004054A3C7
MSEPSDEAMPAPTPAQLALLAVPAIVIGVLSALVLRLLDVSAGALEDLVWTTVPEALGIAPDGWWIVVVLTATGLAVGVCLQLLPGHGGPDTATTELVEPPLRLRVLPGLAVVTALGLAGGVSLGPENPIIAINVALAVAVLGRFMPRVGAKLAMLMAGAGTIGALFGSPVAAALLFTGILAAVRGGGALWDKLFLPLASAAAAALTMHLLGAPPLEFQIPLEALEPIDLLWGTLIAIAAVIVGLAATYLFPLVHRAFHGLRHPILIATAGGFVLGLLGLLGGPITLFKGLDQMGELLENPDDYDAPTLALIVGVKILALLVAASAAFRGGRVFPAAFIGVAFGMLGHALFPDIPLAFAVACALLGILLVVTRDGWLALFLAVAVSGDISLLSWLCAIVLPTWLLVSKAPEFRITSRAPAGGSPAAPDTQPAATPAPAATPDAAAPDRDDPADAPRDDRG